MFMKSFTYHKNRGANHFRHTLSELGSRPRFAESARELSGLGLMSGSSKRHSRARLPSSLHKRLAHIQAGKISYSPQDHHQPPVYCFQSSPSNTAPHHLVHERTVVSIHCPACCIVYAIFINSSLTPKSVKRKNRSPHLHGTRFLIVRSPETPF